MTRPAASWAAAASALTAAWVAVAWRGGDPSFVTADALGAAAAAGTAAVVAAGWRPPSLAAARLAVPILVGLPVAVAGAAAGHPGLLVVALGLAGLAVLPIAVAAPSGGEDSNGPRRRREWAPLLVAAGCDLVAVAILLERVASDRWILPGPDPTARRMALAGAAFLVAAAVRGPTRAWALAPPGLVVAVAAATHLPALGGVVVAGAVAVAAAVLVRHPAAALAALAVAAAPVGPTVPAAWLLAAAAVLSLAVRHRAAAVLALPGASALATGLVAAEPTGSVWALALTATLTALLLGAAAAGTALVARPPAAEGPGPPDGRPDVEALPALALAAWLLLAPGTWTWAGEAGLEGYDRGVAVAVAAAALAVATMEVAGARPARRRRRRRAGPEAVPQAGPEEPAGGPLVAAGPVVIGPARRGPAPPARPRPRQDGDG